MKNWEYSELIEAVKENFRSFINEGVDIGQAAERCFYEFENVVNEGYCENVIVCSTIGLLLSSGNRISQRQLDKLKEVLQAYDFSKVLSGITGSEAEVLNIQVNEAKRTLFKLEII